MQTYLITRELSKRGSDGGEGKKEGRRKGVRVRGSRRVGQGEEVSKKGQRDMEPGSSGQVEAAGDGGGGSCSVV